MKAFTILCRDLNDDPNSTTWVGHVEATDAIGAARVGRSQCAADWGYEEQAVSVIAVLHGQVSVALWEDGGLELDQGLKAGENPDSCMDIQLTAHGVQDSPKLG